MLWKFLGFGYPPAVYGGRPDFSGFEFIAPIVCPWLPEAYAGLSPRDLGSGGDPPSRA